MKITRFALVVWLAGSSLWAADPVSLVVRAGAASCSAASSSKLPTVVKVASLPPQATPVFQENACAQCSARCDAPTQRCKDGSVKSCYEAAACLCQCNLDAGGCGSSTSALRECVDKNSELARQMER